MKYSTIATAKSNENAKKSTFTVYAEMDFSRKKMVSSAAEITSIRGELEIVQRALKVQTRRCRQLVAEYTRRLQQKDQQYETEKCLRDDQLAKVLRALIIFEGRLKQEQKFISHQLKERDHLIKKQSNEIKKLLAKQYCKNCNRYCGSPSPNLESLDSSSEYQYQSSAFESLDSSSDIYGGAVSEKSDEKGVKRRPKKPNTATYFEVLKLRNASPCSNEDDTSNDYDNFDSLPPESVPENHRIEEIKSKISESMPVFEGGETNDWYASASDQEEDEKRDVYRNNPVLECMNQILLQNINDSLNSPPKTPNLERKSPKKVKFSDEEAKLTKENLAEEENGYYETPIQKAPNFYETPQSIYSNDYEQILSKCSESYGQKNVYVDLDCKAENGKQTKKAPPALPPKPANLMLKYKTAKNDLAPEPDYCSISELNLPQKQAVNKKINVVADINPPSSADVLKAKKRVDGGGGEYVPVSGGTLIVKKCVEKLNIQLAKQTPIKSEIEIPKLPQVSEILIPEDDPNDKDKQTNDERISQDNYVKNNSQILKLKNKRPILIGTSVSSLISDFNNQIISEIGKQKPFIANFENLDQTQPTTTTFDLSQNFEEFKLDDCEIEEFDVSNIPDDDMKNDDSKDTRVELIRATDDVPNLSEKSVQLLKKQLELHKTKVAEENQPSYEYFLECTGLSSKAILTPSRMLSNHKSMLKPKDIKFRSKINKANLFDRHSTSTIKYWSEPYI